MTPLLNPSTPAEQLCNESHIRTRNVVERLFGVLTEQLHNLRVRCLDFYIEGATQIQNRFDFSSTVLQNMALLNPHVIFNEYRESIMPLATHFPNLVTKNNLQALDLE
jgi:hypothetical protein